MVNPLIVDPDPEPDIEGDIRNQSPIEPSLQHQQQSPPSPSDNNDTLRPPIPALHVFNEKDYALDTSDEAAVTPVNSVPSTSEDATTRASTLNPPGHGTKEGVIDDHRSPRESFSRPNAPDADDAQSDQDEQDRSLITWGACFKVSCMHTCMHSVHAYDALPFAPLYIGETFR